MIDASALCWGGSVFSNRTAPAERSWSRVPVKGNAEVEDPDAVADVDADYCVRATIKTFVARSLTNRNSLQCFSSIRKM